MVVGGNGYAVVDRAYEGGRREYGIEQITRLIE